MTIDISDNDPRINYTVASGVTQTSFTVPFEFFEDSDLNVYVDTVLKTITTDYTVSGGDGSTGTITMSVTGAAGDSTVTITRDVTIERVTDFSSGVDISRAALNTQLDTLTAIAADLEDLGKRAIRVSDTEIAPSLDLPDIDTRKGRVLGFNETTGAVQEGPEIADVETLALVTADIATLADIEDGTIATDAISNLATVYTDIDILGDYTSQLATLSPIAADIQTLADIEDGTDATDAIQTVASISTSIVAVASSSANIAIVGGAITNVNNVGSNITNVNTVAGISSDVSAVAAISGDVTVVADNALALAIALG